MYKNILEQLSEIFETQIKKIKFNKLKGFDLSVITRNIPSYCLITFVNKTTNEIVLKVNDNVEYEIHCKLNFVKARIAYIQIYDINGPAILVRSLTYTYNPNTLLNIEPQINVEKIYVWKNEVVDKKQFTRLLKIERLNHT